MSSGRRPGDWACVSPRGGLSRDQWVRIAAWLLFALYAGLIVYRASTTTLVGDKAYTYLHYVRAGDLFDLSIANNHLLLTAMIAAFSPLHDYSELFIRLPNLLLLAVLGAWLIREVPRDYAHPLFLLLFFFSPYVVADFWGLGRGYATSLFFITLGVLYILRDDRRSLMKANYCFALAVFANLTALFAFAAFQALHLYRLWVDNGRRLPWHLLSQPAYLFMIVVNLACLWFFYRWGKSVTGATDPLYKADDFMTAVVYTFDVLFPSIFHKALMVFAAAYCLLAMLTGNRAVGLAFLFLGLAVALSLVPLALTENRGYLVGRLWIPYWPLLCMPLLAALRGGRSTGAGAKAVATLLTAGLVILFATEVELNRTAAWSADYEQVARLFEQAEQGGCVETAYPHLAFYIEKEALDVAACAAD